MLTGIRRINIRCPSPRTGGWNRTTCDRSREGYSLRARHGLSSIDPSWETRAGLERSPTPRCLQGERGHPHTFPVCKGRGHALARKVGNAPTPNSFGGCRAASALPLGEAFQLPASFIIPDDSSMSSGNSMRTPRCLRHISRRRREVRGIRPSVVADLPGQRQLRL